MSWSSSDRASRLPDDWPARKRLVFRRDGFRCKLNYLGCLKKATQVDHKNPGDDHNPDNLQAVCSRCHGTKSSQEGNAAQARKRALRRRPPERHPGIR